MQQDTDVLRPACPLFCRNNVFCTETFPSISCDWWVLSPWDGDLTSCSALSAVTPSTPTTRLFCSPLLPIFGCLFLYIITQRVSRFSYVVISLSYFSSFPSSSCPSSSSSSFPPGWSPNSPSLLLSGPNLLIFQRGIPPPLSSLSAQGRRDLDQCRSWSLSGAEHLRFVLKLMLEEMCCSHYTQNCLSFREQKCEDISWYLFY